MMAAQKSECPAATGQNANQNLLNGFKHNARRTVLARDTQRQTLLEALQLRIAVALEKQNVILGQQNAELKNIGAEVADVYTAVSCVVGAL